MHLDPDRPGRVERRSLTQADREVFLLAWEEFGRTGTSSVRCDACQSTIEFVDLGTAWKHQCACGKFTGTLRGL